MRRLLVSLLAMALAAVGPPDAGAAATRSKCQSLTGRDLAPARHVKLVERRNADDGADLVGCLLPRGPLTRIASSADFYTTVHGYAIRQIAGRVVLVATTSSSQYASSETLTVHDLRSRRSYTIAARCAMIGGDDCATGASTTAAAAFVMRAGRAVALVFRAATATVSAFSSLGRSRPLDVAAPPDIPPESLRLTGNLAAWTNAGVARRASIP